jgi:hypothetical protein
VCPAALAARVAIQLSPLLNGPDRGRSRRSVIVERPRFGRPWPARKGHSTE